MLREASFKGVSFSVEQADGEIGRRTVLSEYPFRDVPEGEDLGRAARSFSITALFVGADAQAAAQALIDALESKGAGTLVHPWHGTHFVQQQGKARVRWPRFAGGRISIEMSLVEAGDGAALLPDIRIDTDSVLASACDAAQAAVDDVLAQDWLTEVDGYLDAAVAAVDGAMAAVEGFMAPLDRAEALLDRMINAVNHMINAPLDVAKRLAARISNVVGKLENPFSGVSAWKTLMRGQNPWALPDRGSQATQSPAWVSATASGTALPVMPPSLSHWVRRTLVIEAARTLPVASFTSKQDVHTAKADILAALQTELNAAPDTLFPVFQALRRAAADSIAQRLPSAAEVATIDSQATLPALVLAYRVNGTITAADDLVSRNNVTHPGFVPAGTVEVLRDA